MKNKLIIALFAMLIILGLAGCAMKKQPQINIPDETDDTIQITATSDMDVPPGESGLAKYHDFTYNDIKRTYSLYIPKGIKEDAPLVFILHGYSGFAMSYSNITGMNAVADEGGFAVVYPQGLTSKDSIYPGTHWNADFTYSDVDDIGFLTALAEYLQESYGFSESKTFAAGLSNGGFMCYTLAVKSPGTFRAIASVVGTMSGDTWKDRDSSTDPVPVLQICGSSDKTVPIDGSMSTVGGWGGAPRMDDIMEYWADRNVADSMVEQTSDRIYSRIYSDSSGEYPVWYYLIDGYGHNWPTLTDSALDTSGLIWQFFSKFLN